MKKEVFHKKWYYPLIQIIFFGFFILAITPGVWAILYEDDMPFAGVIWIIFFVFAFWFIKRIFYYIMFGDKILG